MEKFVKPELIIIEFDSEDIVTVSDITEGNDFEAP